MKLKGNRLLPPLCFAMLAVGSNTAVAATLVAERDYHPGRDNSLRSNPGVSNEAYQGAGERRERRIHHCGRMDRIEDYMPGGRYAQRDNDILPSMEEPVFEHVSFLEYKDAFTESFRIDAQGTYQVVLSDFVFPKPLAMAGINITTATESLGSLIGPGSFTFEADPGKYFVSFFGKARHLGQYGIEVSMVGTNTVPVPGAAWLFGSGLLGLAGVIRRKTH